MSRSQFWFGKRTVSCLLTFICLLALSAHAAGHLPLRHKSAKHKVIVYVGTYTSDQGSKGIYAYSFDAATGEATPLGLSAETKNPSFVVASHDGRFVYAVNELENYEGQVSGAVSAFAADASAPGKLRFLNQVSSRGSDPAHITFDKTGKYILVANYNGGSVISYPVQEDGSLGDAVDFVQHKGKGIIPGRQDSPHAHEIVPSPNNRFALVADLALDKLIVYRFDAAKGTLTADDQETASVDPGAGPRHLAFGRDGRFVYLLNEMQSTVDAFAFDEHSGALHPVQKISTIPDSYKGNNDTAEIAVHPSGDFLYTSNRGHDSIAIYAIDRHHGTLKLLQIVPTQGKVPRNFAIDPTGKWLFAANQKSDDIVLFRIDQKKGTIMSTENVLQVPSPVCVEFVNER